jgi:hypothetical protein
MWIDWVMCSGEAVQDYLDWLGWSETAKSVTDNVNLMNAQQKSGFYVEILIVYVWSILLSFRISNALWLEQGLPIEKPLCN